MFSLILFRLHLLFFLPFLFLCWFSDCHLLFLLRFLSCHIWLHAFKHVFIFLEIVNNSPVRFLFVHWWSSSFPRSCCVAAVFSHHWKDPSQSCHQSVVSNNFSLSNRNMCCTLSLKHTNGLQRLLSSLHLCQMLLTHILCSLIRAQSRISSDIIGLSFQAPYFWPSNCWEPENTDYGEIL